MADEVVVVFYSWQSDRPNALNRGFIQQALETAAKAIRKDESIAIQPVVERDTQNVPGSPQIADTIFDKITRSNAFVADVSFITKAEADGVRLCPNPNVLVELGFAARALGWDRILLVMNTHFGPVEELPFDLRMRRTLTYAIGPEDPDKSQARRGLAVRFEKQLREVLEQAIPQRPPAPSLLDIAASSVETGRADQASSVRDFMADLDVRLAALNRVSEPGRQPDESLTDALEDSLPVVADFARLAEVLARHGAQEASLATVGGFEAIMQRYRFPPRQGGTYSDIDFDFFKFVGHEMFVVLVAAMMRHERWSLLSALLEEHLTVDTPSGRKSRHFSRLSTHLKTLDMRNTRLQLRRVCLHGDLLKQRHEAEPLKSLCAFNDFIEADWFLFLRTDLVPDESPTGMLGSELWRPWSCIYAEDHGLPAFLVKMERKRFAEKILQALGFTDLALFRERYRERSDGLARLFGGRGGFFEPTAMDADRFGSL
jgi:hypothetical protein